MELNGTIFSLNALLHHMRTANLPLSLPRNGQPPAWEDLDSHRLAYEHDPVQYALLSLDREVVGTQRARILFQVLRASRVGVPMETRHLLDRVVAALLRLLPADTVLTVFLALRRVRANHKHVMRAMVGYLLNHPCWEDLAARRRPAFVDCLEHALGKNVARGCLQALMQTHRDPGYLRRHLMPLVEEPERLARVLPGLYGAARLQDTVSEERADYTGAHQPYALWMGRAERPQVITATNRGDISATLVHLYRDGDSPILQDDLQRAVQEAAATLPRFAGRIALVLDVSASTRGYGDREFCCLSQSVALMLVLKAVCEEIQVILVGGTGELPQPEGATDLAGGLLRALDTDPDLAVIVSDGYENTLEGDLAQVVDALPQTGVTTPVVFCHSKFTNQDDLALRCPAPGIPQEALWHQDEFESLLLSLFTRARGSSGEVAAQAFLKRKLEAFEKEFPRWKA